MNSGHRFSSIVNKVNLTKSGDTSAIRKQYFNIALRTGISLPPERKEIEVRTLTLLRSIKKEIKTPEILYCGEDYIEIQYIKGPLALHVMQQAAGDLCQQFESLGSSLAICEEFLFENRNRLFDGLIHIQNQCAETLKRFKTPRLELRPQQYDSVSTGDMGLKNLIYSSPDLYAIDFEFCHLSKRGRDTAQLFSQLNLLGKFEQAAALVNGYQRKGGSFSDISFWSPHFADYYEQKNGKA
ncbi:MAG: hypothetical protein ACLGJD_06545 [Gammaproteobacteria bacterium]